VGAVGIVKRSRMMVTSLLALAGGPIVANASPEDVSRCVPLGKPLTAEMRTFVRDSSLEPRDSCNSSTCRVTVVVRGVNGRTVDLGTFGRKDGEGYLCIWPPTRSGGDYVAGEPVTDCRDMYRLVRVMIRRRV